MKGAHPLTLMMAVVLVFSGLFGLQKEAPEWMPLLFFLSLLGLAIRLAQLRMNRRSRRGSGAAIDYERLHRIDFESQLPDLKDSLRGQDEVIDRVVARIQQNLVIAAPGKTLGAFMLVGPTGTGKSYLGELVAEALYPRSGVLALRMNQYKEREDVSTLLGPPPGYAGYEVGGSLTRPVIENPYRVVILDEFEKAHPDVKHCFYDILDTAHCTEKSSGKVAHFNACVFFATCNLGADGLRTVWAETEDPILRAGRAREAMSREGWEKPLLARFDGILLMDKLNSVFIAEVACLQIVKYWKQYGIEVTYASPEVLVETVKRNVEFQDYGVRQLASLIQESTSPLIQQALKGGARRVQLDYDRDSGHLLVKEA